MKQLVDLNSHPYFECSKGDIVEVFINDEPRGFYSPGGDFQLYVVVVPSAVENDDLPF